MRNFFIGLFYVRNFASSTEKRSDVAEFYPCSTQVKLNMKKTKFTLNIFGVRIKECCASCAWKDATRLQTKRRCNKQGKDVSPCSCCKHWTMSRQMMEVHKSVGQIKRREYQLLLLHIREREMEDGVEERRIEDIRAEFESQYGSIYINF